jgi:hypothetical protein
MIFNLLFLMAGFISASCESGKWFVEMAFFQLATNEPSILHLISTNDKIFSTNVWDLQTKQKVMQCEYQAASFFGFPNFCLSANGSRLYFVDRESQIRSASVPKN